MLTKLLKQRFYQKSYLFYDIHLQKVIQLAKFHEEKQQNRT